MKPRILKNLSLSMLLFLTACASSGLVATPVSIGAGSQLTADYPNALPVLSQLAIGTLKLKDTAHPIDKAEAQKLLPLWKVLRTLSTSNSAAVEEINAAIRQIERTMTPEQIKAIADMRLTQQDMAAVFGTAFGGGSRTLTPEQQATRQAARQSGQGAFGPGGFPGGGFGGFGGGGQPTQQSANSTRAGSGINIGLVSAVIAFLQSE
jgi:hypothetical protein